MGQNHLGREKSPYLRQHQHNPIWWFSWGPEAFAEAKKKNKIIFLSVGYSTCHWCHVMEKDSFEKPDVAEILNRDFVSIKVDREERPDVDALYMDAVQAMTGGGGWPMSVLLMPDGRPFWGGTFVHHDQFVMLLKRVTELWKSSPEQITEGSDQLTEFLKTHSDLPGADGFSLNTEPLKNFLKSFEKRFDEIHGGTQGAPKFPSAHALMLLLRINRRTADAKALHMVEHTLKQMRRGGMYDQIGGGFHRYAVDDHWLIPHFEKMLYDNALLATASLETYQVTQDEEYAQIAREILDYTLHDMTDSQGGFYSAEDADSEHIEGKFYVWSEEGLKSLLTKEEFEHIKLMFHVTPEGNFHAHKTGDEVSEKRFDPPALHGNVLFLAPDAPLPDFKNATTKSAFKKMRVARDKRPRPLRDEKILVGWNGLMISAMAKGCQVLGEKKYGEAAVRAASFILESVTNSEGELHRRSCDGESRHHGLAEDYSFFIEGLLNLYETDFEARWFLEAQKLQEKQDQLFWDSTSGSYFNSDGRDGHLITRSKTYEDNVVPSANSVACLNLLKLFSLTGHFPYREKATAVLKAAGFFVEKHPSALAKLLQSLDRLTDISPELALIKPSEKFLSELHKIFSPNLTIAVNDGTNDSGKVPLLKDRAATDGKPTFYLCEGMVCKMPVHAEDQILSEIRRRHPISDISI